MDIPIININPDKARAIKGKKHPWIFDGAITKAPEGVTNGALVEVSAGNFGTVGFGLYCKYSRIRIRMITFEEERPSEDWLSQRIKTAFGLRKRLNLASNALRLVNGEGDFLPGLVVDVYGTTTVVRPLVRYMELHIGEIVSTLEELFPGNKIFLKRDEHTFRNEHLELTNRYLSGEGQGPVIIEEHGLRYLVDIENGQKTGFYLDQRENRKIVASVSRDRTVCNLFCYTGAFSIAARKAGATKVISVDSSQGALKLAKENVAINGETNETAYEWLCEDVFNESDKFGPFDIIVLDPPPFARKKTELEGAITGYRHLNEKAIRSCSENGFLFTFSCSGAVSPDIFRDTVRDAGLRAHRNVRVVRELHADMDHPVSLVHPEGEYLKGLMLHVE